MIISHAPNERYRQGWDRIYNKESVMEYTDCENCARLEAENADLQVENEELREESLHLYSVLSRIQDAVADVD